MDVLTSRISELGLKEEDYSWYLDLRRYGGTKHAGYGLGFERLIMYITRHIQHPGCASFPDCGHCGILKAKKRTFPQKERSFYAANTGYSPATPAAFSI